MANFVLMKDQDHQQSGFNELFRTSKGVVYQDDCRNCFALEFFGGQGAAAGVGGLLDDLRLCNSAPDAPGQGLRTAAHRSKAGVRSGSTEDR